MPRWYWALVGLRLVLALTTPSYIHPDEHHQCAEAVAGRAAGLPSHIPWEYANATTPLRSLLPPLLLCAPPLAAAAAALPPSAARAYALLAAPRLAMFLLSCAVDAVFIAWIRRILPPPPHGAQDAAAVQPPIVLHTRDTPPPGAGDARRRGPVTPIRLRRRRGGGSGGEGGGKGGGEGDEGSGGVALLSPPLASPRGEARPLAAVAAALFAASYVQLVFATRPLANGVELAAAVFALAALAAWEEAPGSMRRLVVLAGVVSLGAYVRPTFGAYGVGVAGAMAVRIAELRSVALLAKTAVVGAATAGAVAGVCAVADSYAYGAAAVSFPPLNFVRYNTDGASLADHGLHPRATHVVVNTVLMFGPVWAAAVWSVAVVRDVPAAVLRASAGAAVFLAALSAVPHQEPRFLLPLLPSLVAAAAPRFCGSSGRRWWAAFVLFNVAGGVVYGVAHQGGVLPALIHTAGELAAEPAAAVVAFHTYMVPRHVLQQFGSFVDLAGAPLAELNATLASVGGTVFVIAPDRVVGSVAAELGLDRVASFWPHVSFEDLGLPLVLSVWRRASVYA